ncbi:DUF948 domain-containing protein [Paenibacillus sp. sptzw28]|uniref:DUF948 domain-containing protein n=1 Tax=Paenibacillus sp. sptzw28 TaxID=715179 RepID=UPI001C6DF746|nr:DUF948 domain-containing protein [Paenibacillus sp. sptzw28]QYR20869.1 DUF948 domain-containing protein [Paenibacillus sp. sptzw28]
MSGSDIAMLVIGLSVAVLAVFMVQTLRKVQTSLDAAGKTLLEVQQVIHVWKDDIGDLVGSARKLTDRVDEQIGAIEPLMASVRETGAALHEVAGVAHGFSSLWSAKLRRRAEAAAAKDAAKAAAAKRKMEAEKKEAITGRSIAAMESAPSSEGASINTGSGRDGYMHSSAMAEQTPAWLAWMETGVHVARLFAKR